MIKYTLSLTAVLVITFVFSVAAQNNNTEEIVVYSEVDSPAIPKGGWVKFFNQVSKKVSNPRGWVGKIYTIIVIDDNGLLLTDSTRTVLNTTNSKLDIAIVKAINNLNFEWKPAKINGKGYVYQKILFPMKFESD